MDKIAKALNKLSPRERKIVREILESLQSDNFKDLNIKKLKGYSDIFRVRKGKIRIIYRWLKTNDIYILAIERRTDVTYNKF